MCLICGIRSVLAPPPVESPPVTLTRASSVSETASADRAGDEGSSGPGGISDAFLTSWLSLPPSHSSRAPATHRCGKLARTPLTQFHSALLALQLAASASARNVWPRPHLRTNLYVVPGVFGILIILLLENFRVTPSVLKGRLYRFAWRCLRVAAIYAPLLIDGSAGGGPAGSAGGSG